MSGDNELRKKDINDIYKISNKDIYDCPAQTSANQEPINKSLPKKLVQGDNSLQLDPYSVYSELAHKSRTVLRLGQMLLACGASAYRVKYSMAKLAKAMGIDEHHAQVTFTEIGTTAYAHGTFRTELAEHRSMKINADRIDKLSNYINSLEGKKVCPAEVDPKLDEIDKIPALYNGFIDALASGVACAAFAFLNNGGAIDCAVVAVAAFFGQGLRRKMMFRRMNHFGTWMLCGGIAALIYMLLLFLIRLGWQIPASHGGGFVSALLFLVPGFPLVTGIIDLVRQDYQSGICRLTYVFMLLISVGTAVWAVSLSFNWSLVTAERIPLAPWVFYLLSVLASWLAAFGFAMLFNSPVKVCTAAAFIGALVNVCRIAVLTNLHFPMQAVAGLAALVIGLLATLIAKRTRFSRVTLSVPAVVIMIPGVPLFKSLAYLNNGKIDMALTTLFMVFFTIIAIGVGLAISRMVTDKNWLMDKPRKVPKLDESSES